MAADQQLIRSRWSSDSQEDAFDLVNPATGALTASIQGASPATVDAAVTAARAAFESHWRWIPPLERGRHLTQAAGALRQFHEEIAKLESQEMGKPLTQARLDVDALVGSFAYFGGLTAALPNFAQDNGPVLSVTIAEPYGVVAGVIPFNWPPIHTGAKTAPALAAGNTVVLKAPEQAPHTVTRIVEILAEALPPDVVHVLTGGAAVGQALVAHPGVSKISFTGSTRAGTQVLIAAAERITPVMTELGGKNAMVVLEDADLDLAAAVAIDGSFYNQGEACTAASRILVHESVHDDFLDRFCRSAEHLVVGDPADPATHVGPLVTAQQRARVLEYLDIAAQEGARVATQASLPQDERLRGGCWVAPTVLADVTPDMRVATEEIFGPVASVLRFTDDADAVRIANGTPYGLVASVISRDVSRALAVGRGIDAGIVFINNYFRMMFGTPFGGTKQSGSGREHAVETLREYSRSKSFRLPSGLGEPPTWPPPAM